MRLRLSSISLRYIDATCFMGIIFKLSGKPAKADCPGYSGNRSGDKMLMHPHQVQRRITRQRRRLYESAAYVKSHRPAAIRPIFFSDNVYRLPIGPILSRGCAAVISFDKCPVAIGDRLRQGSGRKIRNYRSVILPVRQQRYLIQPYPDVVWRLAATSCLVCSSTIEVLPVMGAN
jgi:hypothetical protein